MVTVTLTNCPPRLRGDLSKWLMEINEGVYVGKVNARVREQLWKRICDNIVDGRATMVYNTNNEQGMDFHVHNTSWEIVDYEGINLVRRPSRKRRSSVKSDDSLKRSKASMYQMIEAKRVAQVKKKNEMGYIVLDVETTGLEAETDDIIELAAIHIVRGEMVGQMSELIKIDKTLPSNIVEITGITDDMLAKDGIELGVALDRFFEFIEGRPVVSHNISFDRGFINEACRRLGRDIMKNVCKDTLALARRRVSGVENYRLVTLAKHFGIEVDEAHRALADCMMIYKLYEKLNEI